MKPIDHIGPIQAVLENVYLGTEIAKKLPYRDSLEFAATNKRIRKNLDPATNLVMQGRMEAENLSKERSSDLEKKVMNVGTLGTFEDSGSFLGVLREINLCDLTSDSHRQGPLIDLAQRIETLPLDEHVPAFMTFLKEAPCRLEKSDCVPVLRALIGQCRTIPEDAQETVVDALLKQVTQLSPQKDLLLTLLLHMRFLTDSCKKAIFDFILKKTTELPRPDDVLNALAEKMRWLPAGQKADVFDPLLARVKNMAQPSQALDAIALQLGLFPEEQRATVFSALLAEAEKLTPPGDRRNALTTLRCQVNDLSNKEFANIFTPLLSAVSKEPFKGNALVVMAGEIYRLPSEQHTQAVDAVLREVATLPDSTEFFDEIKRNLREPMLKPFTLTPSKTALREANGSVLTLVESWMAANPSTQNTNGFHNHKNTTNKISSSQNLFISNNGKTINLGNINNDQKSRISAYPQSNTVDNTQKVSPKNVKPRVSNTSWIGKIFDAFKKCFVYFSKSKRTKVSPMRV